MACIIKKLWASLHQRYPYCFPSEQLAGLLILESKFLFLNKGFAVKLSLFKIASIV